MPLFEFKCVECGRVVEKLYPSFDAMQQEAPRCSCAGSLERQQSAPSFKVNGFNQMTGYASEQVRRERHGSIVTEARGNFEAFDRLT